MDQGTGQWGVHSSSLRDSISTLDVGNQTSYLRTVKENALNSPSVTHLFQIFSSVYMLLTMEMVTKAVYPP